MREMGLKKQARAKSGFLTLGVVAVCALLIGVVVFSTESRRWGDMDWSLATAGAGAGPSGLAETLEETQKALKEAQYKFRRTDEKANDQLNEIYEMQQSYKALTKKLAVLEAGKGGAQAENWTDCEQHHSFPRVGQWPPPFGLSRWTVEQRTLATVYSLGWISYNDNNESNTEIIEGVSPVQQMGFYKTQAMAFSVTDWRPENNGKINHVKFLLSGEIRPLFKFRPIGLWGGVSWHVDVPDKDWEEWTKETEGESCIHVAFLDAKNKTLGMKNRFGESVESFPACWHPGPWRQKTPYNLTLVYTKPPVLRSKQDVRKQGLVKNGFIGVVPNLAYHFRHGVDQAVFYIPHEDREHLLGLLDPFIGAGLVSVVFVNDTISDDDRGYKDFFFGKQRIMTQWWFNTDAHHRLKGITRLVRAIDYDEFLYNGSWNETNGLMQSEPSLFSHELKKFGMDDNWRSMSWMNLQVHWQKPQFPFEEMLIMTQRRFDFYPRTWGKCFNKPHWVSSGWVHAPSSCYDPTQIRSGHSYNWTEKHNGRECEPYEGHWAGNYKLTAEMKKSKIPGRRWKTVKPLKYAHIREMWGEHQNSEKEREKWKIVVDKLWTREAEEVQREVCMWHPGSCRPVVRDWMPERVRDWGKPKTLTWGQLDKDAISDARGENNGRVWSV